jgi:hypothetical protein
MTRSGRSALVEHHPWLRRLGPELSGSVCPVVIHGVRGSPHDALAPAEIRAGSQGVAIARRAHFPGYLVGCKLERDRHGN